MPLSRQVLPRWQLPPGQSVASVHGCPWRLEPEQKEYTARHAVGQYTTAVKGWQGWPLLGRAAHSNAVGTRRQMRSTESRLSVLPVSPKANSFMGDGRLSSRLNTGLLGKSVPAGVSTAR